MLSLLSTVMFGSWFDHVKGWLKAKDQDHIFYISYEEMIQVSICCTSHIAHYSFTAWKCIIISIYFHNKSLCVHVYCYIYCVLQDLKGCVTKIAQFLEKPLSGEVIEKIAENCLFKNMKKNKMSNYSLVPEEFMNQKKSEFLRKGKSAHILYFTLGKNTS